MFPIQLYTFEKNPNSTKRPGDSAETLQIALIEPTSIVNPNIALVHKNPTKYNYAYIPEFKRYYFINDWVYSGNRWTANCTCDVLASWKEDIGRSNQYVLRSASEYDGAVIDLLYPAKCTPIIAETRTDSPYHRSYEDGAYIVGIVNGDSSAHGAVAYYAYTPTAFRSFCNYMMSTTTWIGDDFGDITQDLLKAIFNPFQYVASAMWLPLPIGGSGNKIPFGWWSLDGAGSRIGLSYLVSDITLDIPKHPQSSRGAYVNYAPYSNYTLLWPTFGQFPLPPDIVGSAKKLNMFVYLDPVTGMGDLTMMADDSLVMQVSSQLGVPVTLSNFSQDLIGSAGNLLSTAANVVSGGLIGDLGAIGDGIKNLMPSVTISGSTGSITKLAHSPVLRCEFFPLTEDDPEHRGRPLMKNRKLDTLSGFTLCSDVELESECTANELDMIKGYLNGGFYYE